MFAFETKSRRYHIESHGNGWGYGITDQKTGVNLWFQDDDAIQIQEKTNNFEYEEIITEYFDGLQDY